MLTRKRAIGCLIWVIFLTSSLATARDRPGAIVAYKKADAHRKKLLQTPTSNRTLKQYERAISLYTVVIDKDPTSGVSDDALYAIASTYDSMFGHFGKDLYRRRAIYYYKFLAREYPLTRYKSPALSRATSLESKPLHSLKPKVQTDLATVLQIVPCSTEDWTRIWIFLDREVEFQKQTLLKPDRVYFDLQESRLQSDLVGKTHAVNEPSLKQLRVRQNQDTVVRVVLDFDQLKPMTVSRMTYYDPVRIVIDAKRTEKEVAPLQLLAACQQLSDTSAVAIRRAGYSLDGMTAESITDLPTPAPITPATPAPNLDGDLSVIREMGLKAARVVIDPGHGGRDAGTTGPSGLKEKDLVLSVSTRLKELLERRLGLDVTLTRTDDSFVPLEERTAIANKLRADLFLSIHANATRDRRVTGVETFFLNFSSNADERAVATRENAGSQKNIRDLEDMVKGILLGNYTEESEDLAHVVQESLYSTMKNAHSAVRNRGVKKAPFIVLINLNMPGILTEVGFISNPKDESYFKNKSGQNQAAEALYEGVKKYLDSLGSIASYEGAAISEISSPD
ncbi:MAG: N-acetylmuramoyl-L-alanine amidase [Acidobacteriota bacterium]|nr:N-acetylmuramoyl-L-alanine amidase [Acidobacteriota bacterium]